MTEFEAAVTSARSSERVALGQAALRTAVGTELAAFPRRAGRA